MMKRRDLITLLGGAAAWPLAVRAQSTNRMRRIGVLMGYAESDPEAKGFFAGFMQTLADLGWIDGRNLQMNVRWAPGSVDRMRSFAKELVELQPDVILANSTPVTAALQRETRTIPIIFAVASDPVGSGFVASLARPGGNITGFSIAEPSLPGKWMELLTEITPELQRAAMMFNPDTAAYVSSYYLPSFEAAAQSLKVAPITASVRSDAEIETVITSLGREPGGGLLVMPDNFMEIHRAQIISLAARNSVPAVYQLPVNVRDGGLLSYGADFADVFRRAAPYVDRVLRGTMRRSFPFKCRLST
jgi:putative tryptophan/tyrosine transport system substrate-binding protein